MSGAHNTNSYVLLLTYILHVLKIFLCSKFLYSIGYYEHVLTTEISPTMVNHHCIMCTCANVSLSVLADVENQPAN